MNFEYKHLLDKSFSPDSRVWIYQSNRPFNNDEAIQIEKTMKGFVDGWMSHSVKVKGAAYLFFNQFIILMADERTTGVGGCSTDSSVRMIKEIEKRFGVNMFDRTTLGFVLKEKIQLLPMNQLQYAIDNSSISSDTLYFNNLVQTKEELEKDWIITVKESWLMKKISFPKTIS